MQSMDTSVYFKKNGVRSALYFKFFCCSFFRQSTLQPDRRHRPLTGTVAGLPAGLLDPPHHCMMHGVWDHLQNPPESGSVRPPAATNPATVAASKPQNGIPNCKPKFNTKFAPKVAQNRPFGESILLTLGTFWDKNYALKSRRIYNTFFLDYGSDLGRPDTQSDRAGSIQTHVGTFPKIQCFYRILLYFWLQIGPIWAPTSGKSPSGRVSKKTSKNNSNILPTCLQNG